MICLGLTEEEKKYLEKYTVHELRYKLKGARLENFKFNKKINKINY